MLSKLPSHADNKPTRSPRHADIVILQPTPFCNLYCKYCYLASLDLQRRMSMQTVQRIFESLIEAELVGPKLIVNWHAGEPLAVPKSFYLEAFARIAAIVGARTTVKHVIQTNATLIDHEWCELLAVQDVAVGVSLDGPREIHDRNRVDRRGHGSFEKTLEGLRRLRQYNIEYGVLMVVTASTLARSHDVWQFFIEEGIEEVAHNVEEIEGAHRESSIFSDASRALYAGFLREYLQRRREGQRTPRFREIDRVLDRLHGGSRYLQRFERENTPLSLLTFAWDGSYSSFSPGLLSADPGEYGSFLFGNIHRDDLSHLRRQSTFQRVAEDIAAGVNSCREKCDYFGFCGGGCPVNKWCETGTFRSTETEHCKTTVKTLVDVVTGVA